MCTICVHSFGMSRTALSAPRPTHTKEERLVARVTRADKALIERGAAVAGQSVANFVIAHARSAAETLIREEGVIRLTAEESRRLVAALLAPTTPPTAALRKSLKRYREWVISDVNPESPTYQKSAAW
jgi:uncharacterized protein (DUF1778 family)